jgi:hypothetical protein
VLLRYTVPAGPSTGSDRSGEAAEDQLHVEYADGDFELLDVPVDGDGVQMLLVVCLGIS